MAVQSLEFQASLAGLVLGLSFIFSIGPQNLQLIRAGALGESPTLVANVGYLSEFVLVAAGIVLIDSLNEAVPASEKALQVLGVCFLVWCGIGTMFQNRSERPMTPQAVQGLRTPAEALSAMLAVTWLNPLVYVEIMFLAGATASGLDRGSKLCFGLGFLFASALRFYGWTLVGRLLQSWLAERRHRRAFDVVAGTCLLSVAGLLAWHLISRFGLLA